MNDLIDPIVIPVDSSQTVTASKDLNGLGLAYAKMVQTVLYENKVLSAAKKASASVVEEAEARTIQKQIAEEQKLTAAKAKEVAKQQALAEKQIQDEENARFASIRKQISMMENSKRLDNSLQVKALKEETAERERVAAAEKREADQLEYLNMKYDKAYAAAKLYKSVQDEINLAMSKGVGNADQLQAQLNKLEMEYAAFGAGTTDIKNRFVQQAAAVEESRKGVNKWGLLVQQTGYQAGDFLVQLQSGTNIFVAFGQQATQLVGILPMFATELGVSALALGGITLGLSIAIPLITAVGAYFSRTGKNSESASKNIDLLNNALSEFNANATISVTNIDDLRDKFGKWAEEIKKTATWMAQVSSGQALSALKTETMSFSVALESVQKAQTRAVESARAYTKANADLAQGMGSPETVQTFLDVYSQMADEVDTLASNLGLTSYQAIVLNKALSDVKGATTMRDLADKSTLALDAINKMYPAGAILPPELAKAAAELQKVQSAAAAGVTTMEDMAPALTKAQVAAYGLASAMAATNTAANATLSGMIQMEALRTKKQGQVQAVAAGFVGMPEIDNVASRSAVNAARAAILEKNNTPDKTSVGGAAKKDPLVELQKQIALQEELNGKTETEQRVRQALGDDYSNYSPMVIKGLEDQIQKQIELEDRLKEQQGLYDTIQSSMESAFMSMVDGTKSAKDAFKSMAAAIIKELYNVLVVQRLVGSFNASTGTGSGLSGIIGGALGGLFGGGSGYVKGMAGRADGGPISAGVPYMVGERGPEMIIPKSSGTVLTAGQTKLALGGASNNTESYVVHNNITVTGSDSAMVRQEIAKMIPQISSATKAAMIDAKRRGGQMGNAFR